MISKPIVNGIEEEYSNTLNVYRIDARDVANKSIAAQLGLRMTPTYVVFYQNSHKVFRAVGQINRAAIEPIINDLLKSK